MNMDQLFEVCFGAATKGLSERRKCGIAREWYEAGFRYKIENGIPVDTEEHRRKLSEFRAWEDSVRQKAA